MSMTPFVLTNDFSMRNLKKAEKSDFALRYLWIANKYKKTTSGGEDMPSVQSGELAIPDLNVPQEVYDELVDAVDAMSDATQESTAKKETLNLQAIIADRDRIMQWLIRQTIDFESLPLESEREAAKQLHTIAKPYEGFYREPVGQRAALAKGFVTDYRKPENAEYITTLGYEPYLAELEELNDKYSQLTDEKSEKRTEKTNSETTEELTERVENIVKIVNAYANATVVLDPNENAQKFINEVNNLIEEIRIARNRRGSKDDEDKEETPKPDEGGEETPTPEPEPGTGEGEEGEEPDDRPVVQ